MGRVTLSQVGQFSLGRRCVWGDPYSMGGRGKKANIAMETKRIGSAYLRRTSGPGHLVAAMGRSALAALFPRVIYE